MDTEFNEEQVHNNLDEQNEESAMNISSSNSSPQSSSEESDSENIEDENAKRIPELKQQIAANPKDENAYKQLIAIYRTEGNIDEVRMVRVQLKQNLPLSTELWTEWIEDEKLVATDEEEKQSICQLYKSALKEYYSVDLWIAYLQYVASQFPSQMLSVCEEALTNCISDCIEGLRVWAIVLQWYCDHEKPEETEKMFSRMLSHPYQGIEEAYQQYVNWHESQDLPLDEKRIEDFEKGKKEYEKRNEFEIDIAGSMEMDHITTAYHHLQDYIHFEITEMKHSIYAENRAFFLYSKYTYFFRNLVDFWNDYCLFAFNYIKIATTCYSISSKAIKHICYSGSLYEHHVLSLELANKKVAFLNDLITSVNQQVLTTFYDYLHFYVACIASYSRRIKNGEKEAEDGLLFICDHCVDWIRELNKEWYDGIFQIQKVVAVTNLLVLHRENIAYAIWEGILKFHSKEYSYWNEFIQFDRLYNQGKEARSLYRRAAASVEDYKEYILSNWEEYERFYGTIETWNDYLKKSNRYRELQKEKEEREQRKRERRNDDQEGEPEEKRHHMDVAESMETKEVSASKIKKSIKEKKKDASVQRRTLFINNLSFTATEDDLKKHFEQYGKIESINVVRNSHGKSRGFAYIEFENEEDPQKAVVENNQFFMNRKLEVKLSIPQEERKVEKKDNTEQSSAIACTIYVSGLPKGIGEYEFSVFFSKCGKVAKCKVLRDKLTRVGKGTGLLQFENEKDVEEALKMNGQVWQDKTLHIQKSKYIVPI